MTQKILEDFIDALVKDTLTESIEWAYADDIVDALNRNCTEYRPYSLFETEFRRIDFRRSYFCHTNAGDIYLVYELVTPGEEGFDPHEGYELSIQINPYSPEEMILLRQSEQLYRLENAIRSKISNTVRHIPRYEDYYMNLYLRGRAESSD